ncbi:MAG: S9 family peptidase [Bacteroidetes bacterium]|jgi:dipeptidyl aminopeptidase/acylaminoacyl peptidase|nr:S9 family peptidase [Bacteroidota bacterium]MBT6687091.1 S9 family peptidase [Bacteroidota bacterium]MBT7144494.1 S9 family peptidase [Bacteroidota bacterium]MBT7490793.1 S9 family peptidase [Bacteroidota bacterium]
MKNQILIYIIFLLSANIFAQNVMNPEDLWKFKKINNIQVSPDNLNILFSSTSFDIEQNSSFIDLNLYSIKNKKLEIVGQSLDNNQNAININKLPDEKFAANWRPDGKKVTFLSPLKGEYQLFESNTDGSELKQITNIEGGITSYKYSNNMSKILFTREVKDDAFSEIYPDLPKANVNVCNDLLYRHLDTWSDSYHSHIVFADYSEMQVISLKDIMPGEPFDSPLKPFGKIDQIDISSEGKYIAYTCIKKEGKNLAVSTNSDIYLYNSLNSRTSNLTANSYGYDLEPVFSPDGKKLAWLSMNRAGFKYDKKSIMIYSFDEGTTTNYSENFEESASKLAWSDDSEFLYFISGTQATCQIFQLDITKKEISQLTNGDHDYTNIKFSNKNIIGIKETMSSPSDIFSIKISNGNEKQLTFLNKNELDNLKFGKTEKRMVETTDKKSMLVWIVYPPDFDAKKSYPAILYAPDGPQIAVSQTFLYDYNFHLMAANGYIVFAPNRSGVPTFGQEWKDKINRDFGGQCMVDLKTAVDEISKEPFVDRNRIAAVGKNFGGYSVYWLAGNQPNKFKALISHSGIFHFESWYGTTDELFSPNWDLGGSFHENDENISYKFSPHNFIHKWKTPMLITHGENDFRIPISQSVEAFSAAKLQGINSKFLYFNDEGNIFSTPQNAIFWHRSILDWLDTYVKSGAEIKNEFETIENRQEGFSGQNSGGDKQKSDKRDNKKQEKPTTSKGRKR